MLQRDISLKMFNFGNFSFTNYPPIKSFSELASFSLTLVFLVFNYKFCLNHSVAAWVLGTQAGVVLLMLVLLAK